MGDKMMTGAPAGPAPLDNWSARADVARPLRVLIAARRPVVRAGLRGILAERGDVLVVGASESVEDTSHQVAELQPDVLLVAWESGDAIAAAGLTNAASVVATPIVLVGETPAARELRSVLRAGIRGFILSDATADEIGAALHAVAQGLLVLATTLERLLTGPEDAFDDSSTGEPLTDREREVLQFMAHGLPNKTIASRLRISEHTVKFHVGSILAKMDAASRTEAVTRAARRGLLSL
jgi:DNA-binding NarL/FixJ family response regulator